MTDNKVFLVKRSLLEKAFMEKIEEPTFVKHHHETYNPQTNTYVGKDTIFIEDISKLFNECFSQKNSVEITPSEIVILQEDLKFLLATREGIAKPSYQEDRKALLKKLESLCG